MTCSDFISKLQAAVPGKMSTNVTSNGMAFEVVHYNFIVPGKVEAFFVQVVAWHENNKYHVVCQQSEVLDLISAVSGSDEPPTILPMPDGTDEERIDWIKSKINELSNHYERKV